MWPAPNRSVANPFFVSAVACLLSGFWVTPFYAEGLGWRLPDMAAKPAVITPDAGSAGWALPATSRRLSNGAARGVDLPKDRPNMALFAGPTLIITGFSGHVYGHPVLTAEQRALALTDPKYQMIDLDGAVATLTDIEGYGHAFNGDEVTRTSEDQLFAREIGQVFGAVLDDDAHPNLYLSATSAYGLQIIGPDSDGDKLADRLLSGAPEAEWMAGQWGYAPQSGPGTIWRVDGLTGQIDLFANVMLNGKANAAPGLGNLAFDAAHDQLFASDLATGLISRLDLRGAVLDVFDHGVTARAANLLAPVPYDPAARVEITDPAFDPFSPDTWGFAAPARRVWGMTVQGDRLFYAVAAGETDAAEVWSVGLDKITGAFRDDSRWELTLSKDPLLEISDMGFAPDGALILAQRGLRQPRFDYSAFAEVGKAKVLRYVREAPEDDPTTPSVWDLDHESYAIGFAGDENNATGGIAFGPGYDEDGFLDFTQCRGTLWSTGEKLRDDADLQTYLLPGGMLRVDGAMAQPVALRRQDNSPPWISYSTDFDLKYPTTAQSGALGDVVVLGCNGSSGTSNDVSDGDNPDLCIGTSCTWLACLLDPALCKPKPVACLQTTVELRCDGKTGTYVADLMQDGLFRATLDRIKLSDTAGTITSLPQEIATAGKISVPLTGLSMGQVGQINLCRFDAKAAADGVPYDCCNASVTFKLPMKVCAKDIQ